MTSKFFHMAAFFALTAVLTWPNKLFGQTIVSLAAFTMTSAQNVVAATGLSFYANGTAQGVVSFPASHGLYTLTIYARGDLIPNSFPVLKVGIDGVPVATISVTTATFAPYTINNLSATAAPHTLSLTFSNDVYRPPLDQNLFIQRLTIAAVGTTPPPPLSTVSPGNTTYYVSSVSGSDTNNGRSTTTPWRTVSRVNGMTFAPGDRLLFKRGETFVGSLLPRGSGRAGAPIKIDAYGSGTALPVINGNGQESTVSLKNQQYWDINALNITGGTRFGVFVTATNSGVYHHIHLTNLVVHDMNTATPRWDSGLVVVAPTSPMPTVTFDDVLIENVQASTTNLWWGIHVGMNLNTPYDPNVRKTTNVVVRGCTVHHVFGDGIVIGQSQNVLIEYNIAWETGRAPAGISYTPNGIWSFQSDDVVVQWNEGYATHSYGIDGGVFDIDVDSTNTTIQYNYGHDADGYCVAILGGRGYVTKNSIVRFNVCANNDRKSGGTYGDIFIFTWEGGSLDGVQVYNNTSYWNPTTSSSPWLHAPTVARTPGSTAPFFVKNNLVYATTPNLVKSVKSVTLDNNLYWVAGGLTPSWTYGGNTYHSLANLRSLTPAQEMHGIYADPLLNNPTYHSTGWPLTPFAPADSSSPARRNGAVWSGIGSYDIAGHVLPASAPVIDIGAIYSD